jgi:site-specific recombinase XerD
MDTHSSALIRSFVAEWTSSKRTIVEYERHLRRLAEHYGKPLPEITRSELAEYIRHTQDEISPATAKMVFRSVRRFWGWMLADGEIDDDVSRRLKSPKEAEPVTRAIDEHTFDRLIKSIDVKTFNGLRDRALIATAWATGMRLAELAKMKTAHLHLEASQPFVLVPTSKTLKPRVVPLDPMSVRLLSRYLRRAESVFGRNDALWLSKFGQPLAYDGIKQVFDRRSDKLGERITPHMFRRAFAANAVRRGVSGVSVMRAAGWKSPTMVARYTASVADELALAEFGRAFRE